ncbi:MAG TPA: hypothetical protein VGG14_07915 [Candidatus Sulfotelmatobacter sp.]|jgi:hypothetical protein
MIDTALIAARTVVAAKGDGPAVDLTAAGNRTFLLTLDITDIIEQESLEIIIQGSADGATWDAKPVITLPQKFYRGQYPFLLDLNAQPNLKFVRAHWEVARWGRGTETPMFELGLTVKEVPPEVMKNASVQATVPV